MSLKGTQPVNPLTVGLQFALSPSACKIVTAFCTQKVPPGPEAISALARAGFNPEGRKKFARAAATQNCPVVPLTPQGIPRPPTPSGPSVDAPELASSPSAKIGRASC